jgi:hypothetical protein
MEKIVINQTQWDRFKEEWNVSEEYMKDHYILNQPVQKTNEH